MGLSPREPFGRFARLCRDAESYGFDMAWIGDSQLVFKDAYIALTLAAQATSSIQLGPGVTGAVTRHPTVIANSLAGLAEISSGRAVLGLGAGDSSVTPIGLAPATLAELERTANTIRALCAGDRVEYDGHEVQLRPASFPVPVFISASQPGMLRLAGAVADGVILLGAADFEVTKWQLSYIEEGAHRVGRSLEDLTIDVWLAVSVNDDLDAGREQVRPYVTSQARWFHKWRSLPQNLTRFAHDFRAAAEAYDFQFHISRQAKHNLSVSDELVDVVSIVGSAEKCARELHNLSKLKVDRFTFINFPGGREANLRAIGFGVVPELERLMEGESGQLQRDRREMDGTSAS